MAADDLRTLLAPCVDAGAELLDHHRPRWWEHIDLELLDMRSSHLCIVAQTFAGDFAELGFADTDPHVDPYHYGLDVLGVHAVRGAHVYGLNADGANTDCQDEYEVLRVLWAERILARRAAADSTGTAAADADGGDAS